MLSAIDVFFLNYDDFNGSFVDAHVLFEHRTFKRVGFGDGLNHLNFNIDFKDDEQRWSVDSTFTGLWLYTTVYFK